MTTNIDVNKNNEVRLSKAALENLMSSGLSQKTITDMRIRMANAGDNIFSNKEGYVIPYMVPRQARNDYVFVIANSEPFKRVRLLGELKADDPKYIQSRATGSHIYFPPIVPATDWFDTSIPLVVTEGEKKAAAACQAGILCCAVAGVDSWRSRQLVINTNRLVAVSNALVSIRLDEDEGKKIETQIAEELNLLPFENREIYVCYDSDMNPTSVDHVQRAAFDFSIWLETQGAKPKQITLPYGDKEKVALDDFLIEFGTAGFWKRAKVAKFPYRPKIKGWVSNQLSGKAKGREVHVKVARGVLATLDRRGKRYVDKYGKFYYFDSSTDMLHPIPVSDIGDSTFSRYINNEFGISHADRETAMRVMDDFRSVPPFENIERAYKGSIAFKDTFYYQLNDSRMVKITADSKQILRNGDDSILFESGSNPVELIDAPSVKHFGWLNILEDTSLQAMQPLSDLETRVLTAGMFYLSPWMRRWSGMMLPIEVALGEAGSGKSTIFQLRKGIYSGSPRLNQPPDSLKDWYASIGNESGLWVGDNMGHKLDDKFSNELARLVTDPEPTFELRELYTTSDVKQQFVDASFAFTAIYNPISKSDLLQRSFIYNFESIKSGSADGNWLKTQLDGEGRAEWVAHHLDVVQKFLRLAPNVDWGARSKHRLVNLEQSLRVIGKIIGKEQIMESALRRLPEVIAYKVSESDPVMEGLRAFAMHLVYNNIGDRRFTIAEIINWVSFEDTQQRFHNIKVLSNSRSLARYITNHANEVAQASGIYKTDVKRSGVATYLIGESRTDLETGDEH